MRRIPRTNRCFLRPCFSRPKAVGFLSLLRAPGDSFMQSLGVFDVLEPSVSQIRWSGPERWCESMTESGQDQKHPEQVSRGPWNGLTDLRNTSTGAGEGGAGHCGKTHTQLVTYQKCRLSEAPHFRSVLVNQALVRPLSFICWNTFSKLSFWSASRCLHVVCGASSVQVILELSSPLSSHLWSVVFSS